MSTTHVNFSIPLQSRLTDALSLSKTFSFVNYPTGSVGNCTRGEYRSRTDDLLLAKQAL